MGKKIGIVVALVAVLVLGAGGAWWWTQQQPAASAAPARGPQLDLRQASYVTLDKVVVMLKSEPGARNTYMSMDLVLRTDKAHEKALKAELPMLKGVAVRTVSEISPAEGKTMGIEAWTKLMSKDLVAAYDARPEARLFDEVMVSRLIME